MRGPERGFLVITHYQRLLDYIVPDVVHVMYNGRIIRSGDSELAKELEVQGLRLDQRRARSRHRNRLNTVTTQPTTTRTNHQTL